MFSFSFLPSSFAGTFVSAEELYTPEKGYGFVTEVNRRQQETLRFAELNSGFEPLYWYQDQNLTKIQQDDDGCYLDSIQIINELAEKEGGQYPGESRKMPLHFKMNVPAQGNYKVKITIAAPEDMGEVLVFAGRRRLVYRGEIPAGKRLTLTAAVNVCDIIPRGQESIYEDTTLDITVVADKPRLTVLEVEECEAPTLYIAGDSTVTDQSAGYPYAPGTSYCGWGQMLSAYLNETAAVSNHAHSGLTTESFRMEGHYSIVEKYRKPGDYLLIQFAHNDQKLDHLKAGEGYRKNMLAYIKEARQQGVHPVIVTPIARNTWKGNDGTYNDLLKEYAESCIEIGRDMDVPVLDLHCCSMKFVMERGVEAAKPYFFPGDYTHSDDYGAYLMAGYVAQQIKEVCSVRSEEAYQRLANCVTGGFGPWIPAEFICLPEKPAIYEDIKGPEVTELLSEVDRREDAADRASVLDMLIKTCKFFPTNVYNDMFVDVVGHEWYAGTVECAYQNGMIPPELVENNYFYPLRAVTLQEFLFFALNGYKSRKPLPDQDLVQAALQLRLITTDDRADLDRVITRGEAADMCRKMKI